MPWSAKVVVRSSRRVSHQPRIEGPPIRVAVAVGAELPSRDGGPGVVRPQQRPYPRVPRGRPMIRAGRAGARRLVPSRLGVARVPAPGPQPVTPPDRGRLRACSMAARVRPATGRRERSRVARLGVPGRNRVDPAGALPARLEASPGPRRSRPNRSRPSTVDPARVATQARDGPLMPDRSDRTAAIDRPRRPPSVRPAAPGQRRAAGAKRVRARRGRRCRRPRRVATHGPVGRLPQDQRCPSQVDRDAAGARPARPATGRSDEQRPPAGGLPRDGAERGVRLRRSGPTTPAVRRDGNSPGWRSPTRCNPMISTVTCARSCCRCRGRRPISWRVTW